MGPLSSAIKGSRYALRELRIQSAGHPLRIFYVFDPERRSNPGKVVPIHACKEWHGIPGSAKARAAREAPPLEAEPSSGPQNRLHDGSLSLWWPKDHAWVVATEIDGLSTFVAGSHEAVADIVVHPGLEALEVSREMGIG